MTNQITHQILSELKISPNLVIKKSIRGLKGITAEQLISSLLNNSSVEEAAKSLGYSENPVKQAIREILLPKFPERSRSFSGKNKHITTWKITLLQCVNLRLCCICKTVKSLSSFGINSIEKIYYSSTCKICRIIESKRHKRYIVDRTPEWSELELIEDFYNNCPVGFQVDHIIPLRGVLVSGLHVLSNLQYLTIKDNSSKNNKYTLL